MKTETQEPEAPQEDIAGQPEKQKRQRARAARGQLQSTLDAFDLAISDSKQKPAKIADLLIAKATILTQQAAIEAEAKSDEALTENAALKEQKSIDSARISTLEAEVQSLKASQNPVERIEIPDPAAQQLRRDLQQTQQLVNDLAQSVASELDEDSRCRVSVRLLMKHHHGTVSAVCSILGVNSGEGAQALTKNGPELNEAVTLAKTQTPWVRLLRAVLVVREGLKPRTSRTGVESSASDEFTGFYS